MSANSSASASPLAGGSIDYSPLDNSPLNSILDNSHYEQACDQAITMCGGHLRSTIKALIMANEYLEAELMELQAAISSGCMPKTSQINTSEIKPLENKPLENPASNAA